MNDSTAKRIAALLEPLLKKESISIYDIEFFKGGGKNMLKVYLDKDGGIRHEECATVSRYLGDILEMEDIIHGAYSLEVSSPGLTRTLKKPLHFQKSCGRLVKITFRKAFDGPRQVIGRLKKGDGPENFVITEAENGISYRFLFDDVAKAKLEFEE